MADYTVIVDDTFGGIVYGPSEDSWSLFYHPPAYQGTAHQAMSPNASLSFSFVGGREIFIRGNFVGDNNASDSTSYPIFQVDSTFFLDCNPKPPQNGGQFLCDALLPPTITNHTLSMFENPNAEIQQFHIDYIRHGSDSQAARNGNETVVFVNAPDNMAQGLTFDANWQYQKLKGTNDIKKAMITSTPSSTATYVFFGDSFAWWACCMSADTSSNVANGTYSIDGGEAVPFQIGQNFIQGAQCHDEKILFQVDPGILDYDKHTLEVIYNGDNTKMPLTVCGLAGAPSDFTVLDIADTSHHHLSNSSSSSTLAPSSTQLPISTTLIQPSQSTHMNNSSMNYTSSGRSTGIIAGVISAIVFAFLSVFIVVYVLRRKRARDIESRISFDAPRLAIRRVVSSVDLAAHDPPTRRTSIDKESIFEVPPPFYRSSMAKSHFSWRSLSFRTHPRQQTAYVGSDYGASVSSFNPRNSTQSYYHNYQQSEPPRYNHSNRGYDPDPILPLP